jgi:hypothetical protein
VAYLASESAYYICGRNTYKSTDGVNFTFVYSESSINPEAGCYLLSAGPTRLFNIGGSGAVVDRLIQWDGVTVTTTLAISGADTVGFAAGMQVISDPAGAGPSTISSISASQVLIDGPKGAWAIGQKIKGNSVAVTGTPFTDTTAPLTAITIPAVDLSGLTTYFARVQYMTTNPTAATSSFSNWSKFTTQA